MTAAEVLDQARATGVTLWAEGDALRYRGPREALTADLLDSLRDHKAALLAALARPDLPPLSRASKARRRKVLAMLAREGVRYAVLVEDPNTDPVVMTVGTPDGTREVLIPRSEFDPFEVLAKVGRWDTGTREGAKPDPASGSIVITEAEIEGARKGRTVIRQGDFTGAPEVKS